MPSGLRERARALPGLRLAAWYAVLFVAGTLALFALSYALLARSLELRDREAVRLTLAEYASSYETSGAAGLLRTLAAQEQLGAHLDLFVRAIDSRLEEADRLRDTLDSLMDLSEAEAGVMALRREEVPVAGLFEDTIGNPFGLGGNSVTVGVVSFKGRPLDLSTRGTPIEMLQTDAAINPGNSGGPLINARGEAVGINTLIMTGGAQQYSGVGFAVPINVAREILPQLRDTGHVVRGGLGIQIQNVDEDLAKSLKVEEARGAIVSDVAPGSPADKAGLKPGDVVVALDGQPITDASDLSRHVAAEGPDTKVAMDVLRDGSEKTLHATLGSFPDETEAASATGRSDHGYLGVSVQTLTPDLAQSLGIPAETRGAVVVGVESGGRADSAGIRERDVVVSVDGHPVTDASSLQAAVEQARSEELMRLRVRRGADGAIRGGASRGLRRARGHGSAIGGARVGRTPPEWGGGLPHRPPQTRPLAAGQAGAAWRPAGSPGLAPP